MNLIKYVIIGPLVILGYSDILQKKHTIKRNFPVIGNLRYMLEKLRTKIIQYFVETDTEGRANKQAVPKYYLPKSQEGK